MFLVTSKSIFVKIMKWRKKKTMIYSRNVQYFCCISCWVECATFLNRFISSISSSDLIYYCWRRAFFPTRSAEVRMWTSLLIIFFKRWRGTRKRKIFLPFPKRCLCVLHQNVISSYMKCPNIYTPKPLQESQEKKHWHVSICSKW